MAKILVSVVFVLLFMERFIDAGKRKAQGKMTYEMNWLSGFVGCPDFENKYVDFSNLAIVKDSSISTAMSGDFEILEPVIEGTALVVSIEKQTSQGKVLAFTMDVTDLCDHVKEEGMPWSLFIEAMNLDPRECPLPVKKFPLNELKLSMEFADKAMNHDTVGEYSAKLEFKHKGDGLDIVEHDIACYVIGFTVDEVREKSEE